MSGAFLSRPLEDSAVAEFLTAAATTPSALVIEGEPGIGKTTVWLSAVESALERGYRVLSASPAPAETVLAYTTLSDLVSGVAEDLRVKLPRPQQLALTTLLRRDDAETAVTDQRAVGAAFLSLLQELADETPLLAAIDDLQWIDPSSARVLGYAVRRLSAPVGILGTLRSESESERAVAWLQLPRPDSLRRVRVLPLSVGGVHTVIFERLGRSFPRPTVVRIHEVSAGNPFYALELARTIDADTPHVDGRLPTTLADLVRARIGSLDATTYDALLAAACTHSPTVELVAHATGSDLADVVELLEDAEDQDIIAIDGHRIRFTHPLLAKGVHDDAAASRRRAMHRRLAAIVEQPELRARHLALAATHGDELTLQSIDQAAGSARRRGAPVAAAELFDLAIGLGGDTPERRIACAHCHFEAGEPIRARTLLTETISETPAGPLRAQALNLLAEVAQLNDSFSEAAGLLQQGLVEAGPELQFRVPMLVRLAFAQLNSGQPRAAMQTIDKAVVDANRLGQPSLLGEALSMRVMLRFVLGDGFDRDSLRRAVELDDRETSVSVAFRPTVHHALLLAWTGALQEAHGEMTSIRQRCLEHGEESELIFVAFHSFMIEIWRGKLSSAALVAEDAMERAAQLGGDLSLSVALMTRATLSAYAGRVEAARRDAAEALAACQRGSSMRLGEWPITARGFLEVSLGNFTAALSALEPLLSTIGPESSTEIIAASFMPDAVEALVHVGRLSDAEPIVALLERNGSRLDRPWTLAVAARCRGMLLAAQGDLDSAVVAAQRAMTEHERLPMPFERARTQLLLGQLRRRQRHRESASAALREALDSFEELQTPLWAEHAQAELACATVDTVGSASLTPTEQRVARLAASGMTNRDVAATLFVSAKTVEATLARIYKKLDIHTRAELGRYMATHDG